MLFWSLLPVKYCYEKKREEEYKIREGLLDDKQTKEYATLNSLNGFFFS